jgi:hypothetical protein
MVTIFFDDRKYILLYRLNGRNANTPLSMVTLCK